MRRRGAHTFTDEEVAMVGDPPSGPVPIDPPEDVHVQPSLGEHVASAGCWCHPRIDYTSWGPSRGRVWVHRASS